MNAANHCNRQENKLDVLVCHVRDCFSTVLPAMAWPVLGDGSRSELCFARRSANTSDLTAHTQTYKAFINDTAMMIDMLLHLESKSKSQAMKLRSLGWSAFGEASYEELTAFEFGGVNDALFNRSAVGWSRSLCLNYNTHTVFVC